MDCLDRTPYVTECKHPSEEIRKLKQAHDNYHDEWNEWRNDGADYRTEPERPNGFLGFGLHRTVYELACGKHVVKIDRGACQNTDELHKFESLDKHGRALVASVEAYSNDNEILISVRAEPLDDAERDEWDMSIDTDCSDEDCEDDHDTSEMSEFWRQAVKLELDGDLHPGNVGRLHGKLVVIDYAM